MPKFDRTESGYIDQQIKKTLSLPQIGEVVKTREHTQSDDTNNFECDVLIRGEIQQRRRALVAAPAAGIVVPPKKGDLVLVNFIDGDGERPIVTNVLYTAQSRPPLAKSGDIRVKRGDLYVEAESEGNYARISKKSKDDADPDVNIEIDDSGSGRELFLRDSSGAGIELRGNGEVHIFGEVKQHTTQTIDK